MSDILIAGKDLPECLELAEGFVVANRSVFAACRAESEVPGLDSANIFFSQWNRGSAVSARAFVIKSETKFPNLNEYLLYFDASAYAPRFDSDRLENPSAAIDTLISSYIYFTNELLARLEQRKEPVTVAFLVKSLPSKYDVLKNGGKNVHPARQLVKLAQSAFMSLAEETAALVGERGYLSVILAECDCTNELFGNEKGTAQWLTSCFESLRLQKNKQTVKQAILWNKAGSKLKTGFLGF